VIDFIESVCANCPGSLWGEKSFCRVHQKHIGQISSCIEWEKYEADQLFKNHDGQYAFMDLEPAIEAIQRTEQDLRDYKWMVEQIKLYEEFDEYWFKNKPREVWEKIISSPISKYGVEATLPKVKGVTSNPTERQARQFLRAWERAKRYEQKVKRLEEAVSKLQDERERMVAEALMDGEKLYMIAQELNVSRQTVHEIKRSVIKKLAFELYGEETSLLHK
jgi:predicted RNase H-like nuclease (RuvC/YqgF family)